MYLIFGIYPRIISPFFPSEERVLNISDGKIGCACGTREDSSYDMLEVNFCQKRGGDPVMRN